MCPNCAEPSFTVWQKQVLGPGRKKRCRKCGALVSVSRVHAIPSLLLAAAFPVVVIVALLYYGVVAMFGLILLIVLVGALYQHYFVPLVVRAEPDQE